MVYCNNFFFCVTSEGGEVFICVLFLSLISPQALLHLCQLPYSMFRFIKYSFLEMSCFGIFQFGLGVVDPFTVILCVNLLPSFLIYYHYLPEKVYGR